MRRILSLLGAVLLSAAAETLAADAFTEEVFRNRCEQTAEEQIYGEPNHAFLERKLEPGEDGACQAPAVPESQGWPPQRSDALSPE
ncbi:MAG: hypothetical protein HY900_17215 [Deltaproteobacteria bacterium]|nr:hypothetical protein [Deltaproteobacteria bacterium]